MIASRALVLPLVAAITFAVGVPSAWAEPAQPDTSATLARIRDAALKDDWAFQRLADLTDKVGPRLSGSPQAEAAVAQVAAALNAAGLKVTLQPVKVPHWVRGEERGELVEYAGRPAGITQKVQLTALGGSAATPAKGLTLPVLVVHSFAELDAHAAEAKGKIVLISVPFNQLLADNGRSGEAYGQAGEPRFRGPAALAKVGAAAALVRSVGGADFRIPHTGATVWDENGSKIPAAAVTAEDALLIERLNAQGPVTMKLTLTPQTLPDADSHNVLGDLVGSEKPDEVVIVSGHLDSWDLATGAIDDGAGVASAMGAVRLLKSLGLQPRRTIRAVAWMNEENGTRGGKAYFEANKNTLSNQFAAIESDSGAGRPLGLLAHITKDSMPLVAPLQKVLGPIGATAFELRDNPIGADISPLQRAGVPGFEPLLDTRSYFNYHHTPADTLDKVDPENIRRQVALLASLAYLLADSPEPLPRLPVNAKDDD
jgi:carboxypeptidase Q